MMLRGKMPAVPRVGFNVVDVRDLADLHLRAMRSPDAAGQRFVAAGNFLWFSDVAAILREHFGPKAARAAETQHAGLGCPGSSPVQSGDGIHRS